jgi:hypothetical protein
VRKSSLIVLFLTICCGVTLSQGTGNFSGSFDNITQYYLKDNRLQTIVPQNPVATNNYFLVQYSNGPFSGALRYEMYLPPVTGFPYQFEGTAIAHRYARFSKEKIDITAGNFYEQFGSGLIFRAYESRELGINNSVDGVRVIFKPSTFIKITGIYGLQKKFLENSKGILRGADAELNLGELIKSFPQIRFASGFISRYQPYTGPLINYPATVNAFSYRISANFSKIGINSEYVSKSPDPSSADLYQMMHGKSFLLNGNYSSKRFGMFLAARFLSNMDFRSERESEGNYQMVNYLPSNTLQHSFLLGNIYPYSTQSAGEASIQGDLSLSAAKGSIIGGKWGTKFRFNFSHIRNLKKDQEGYQTLLSAGNKVYFQDISIEMNRKLSSRLKTIVTIVNLRYDKSVVEGPAYDFVKATIVNTEFQYRITSLFSIRTEIQHLWTKQDKGNWLAGLMEIGYAPKWSLFISDMIDYNNGSGKAHYYNTGLAYSTENFRISGGYGRQREGQICAGGICQRVPAYRGFNLQLNASF